MSLCSHQCLRLQVRSTVSVRVQLARDHDALDLRRAFVDLGDLRVAEQPLDRIVLHVAVSAEDLDRLRRHPHRRLAREQLAIELNCVMCSPRSFAVAAACSSARDAAMRVAMSASLN